MIARYFNPFRLATYLLILYCAGHTWGALLSTPHFGQASDAVFRAMKSVHFQAQGADSTWYGFYMGFGLMVSVFFLFSAAMTWFMGGLVRCEKRALAPLIWGLFLSYIANTVLAWAYFFPAPIIFSTLISALLGFEALKTVRPAPARKRAAAWEG